METKKNQAKDDILKRLRRVEGQVRGIQKMIEEDKYCGDILTQIAAVRGAVNNVGRILLENHSIICIENAASSLDKERALDELSKIMQSFMKFAD